jgi:hypothetical protein
VSLPFCPANVSHVFHSRDTVFRKGEMDMKYFSDFCIRYKRESLSVARVSGPKATSGVLKPVSPA